MANQARGNLKSKFSRSGSASRKLPVTQSAGAKDFHSTPTSRLPQLQPDKPWNLNVQGTLVPRTFSTNKLFRCRRHNMDFLADIHEKEIGTVKPPSFPEQKSATTGFPEHKKRTRVSAFKQKRQTQNDVPTPPQNVSTIPLAYPSSAPSPAAFKASEKERIDRENQDLLASMSPEEIEEERRELLSRLDPSIVQMLMRRANIEETNSPSPFDEPAQEEKKPQESSTPTNTSAVMAEETTTPADPDTTEDLPMTSKPSKTVRFEEDDDDAPPPEPPADLFPASSQPPPAPSNLDGLAVNATHFPHPKELPDLDPSDPDFLANLHEKFFPNLPADPSKLAWMAPIPTPGSTADQESPYYPGQSSLPISALRFDFRGALLPPAKSRTIPMSKGLHHHGEAPEAAGYTVAELARLARSAVPAQRCVAFQVLGRILYRLGKGDWGADSEVAMGLWQIAEQNRVMDTLLDAANVPEGSGHRGSKAYATEALWLFEKGGWKEKWRGR